MHERHHLQPARAGSRGAALLLAALTTLAAGGCASLGALAYLAEKDKEVEIAARYEGLENQTVAVVVQVDLATLYEHPLVPANIAGNVAGRLQSRIPGIRVRDPREVARWQYQTPAWSTLPYGDMIRELDVDRIVFIDLYEYRLNPPGNRWVWEGVAAANVGIVERDGFDPDMFAESFNVVANFPEVTGVAYDTATASQIETGLLVSFIEETTRLFHLHRRPKYGNDRADSIR